MHIDDGILTPILIEDDGVSSSNRAQWFDPSMLGVVVELMSRNIRSPGFLARNLNGSKRPKIRETNGSDKNDGDAEEMGRKRSLQQRRDNTENGVGE